MCSVAFGCVLAELRLSLFMPTDLVFPMCFCCSLIDIEPVRFDLFRFVLGISYPLDLCFYFFQLGISCPLDLAFVTSVCYFSDCVNEGNFCSCFFMPSDDLFVCLYEFDFGCLCLF